MAEYGVQQSPVVIPSWIDMQPESDFIKSLYRKRMPESISFYMFNGYKGDRNPFRSNNDGTITLPSLLDCRPQFEAKMNYVFNEDHASFLYSKQVLSQYNTILEEFDEKQSASLHRSGGYIRIHFGYNYEFDGVRPQSVFIFRPVGKTNAETSTYLSDYDNDKILFIPDGVIRGFITTSPKPEDKFPGRPDVIYRSADEKINLQSITLTGNGIHRALQPIRGEDVNYWDLLISRADFCYNHFFGFFGLRAGEYNLFIKAEGFNPIEKKYSVRPGIPYEFRATELTKED
jgi:hypothetical protein